MPVYQKRARARRSIYLIIQQQDGRCFYCKRRMKPLKAVPRVGLTATRDHMHPFEERAKGAPDRIVAACNDCNQAKGDLPYYVFITIMANAADVHHGHRQAKAEISRRDRERAIRATRVSELRGATNS